MPKFRVKRFKGSRIDLRVGVARVGRVGGFKCFYGALKRFKTHNPNMRSRVGFNVLVGGDLMHTLTDFATTSLYARKTGGWTWWGKMPKPGVV